MNPGEILVASAGARPDRTAVVAGAPPARRRTYRELDRGSDALAAALVDELGIRPRDRVAVLLGNGPDLVEALFAVWKAGAAVVALDADCAADEIVSPVNDSEARLLIAGEEFGPALLPLAEKLSVDSIVLAGDGPDEVDGAVRLAALRENADGRRPAAPADAADDVAWLAYPPGATGRRTAAVLTQGDLTEAADAWPAELPPVEAGDVGLIAAPLTGGAASGVLAFVRRAAALVTLGPSDFDRARFLAAVAEHRVTHAWLAPAQVRMVADAGVGGGPGRADLATLKALVSGGPRLDADAVAEAAARIGPTFVPLLVSCGLTVSPREIEDVLLRHAGISGVLVAGVPDERLGQVVTAVVVPAPGARLAEAEVLAFAGAQLAAYKRPKAVQFAATLPGVTPRGGSVPPAGGSI